MVPVMHLIRELAKRRDLTHFSVEKPGFKLELSQLVQAGAGP
jgi:hypothetical protein